jgi:hypothetical protein
MCMLLPVLPGPEIIFRSVHEKSLAISGKVRPILEKVRPIFGHKFFRPTFFLRPLLSFLAGISATWQHWLLPSHQLPHFPLPLPSLPLTPPIPSSPTTDSSISQILKDDYHLPFYEIIILWFTGMQVSSFGRGGVPSMGYIRARGGGRSSPSLTQACSFLQGD